MVSLYRNANSTRKPKLNSNKIDQVRV